MFKKGILLLAFSSLIMFSSRCTPPPLPPTEPSIFGTWSFASSMTTDGFTITDVVITFNEEGTFTQLFKYSGEPKMAVGTFTPATLPADTTITWTTAAWIGTNGPLTLPVTSFLKYSNLTATTVDLYGDKGPVGNGFGDPSCTFSKETQPAPDTIFGTWGCAEMIADGMTMDSVILTINEDATFSTTYYTSDLVTQTGTFAPTSAPADTDLTFHVLTSSGTGAPPPLTNYFLKYSNMTDHAADVYLDPMGNGYGTDGPFDYIR